MRWWRLTAGGERTDEVDNQMLDHVQFWKGGTLPPGAIEIPVADALTRDVLVPTYFDTRYAESFDALKTRLGSAEISIARLMDDGLVTIRGGHGSPGNDVRVGSVPYVKVSDIRSLRVSAAASKAAEASSGVS